MTKEEFKSLFQKALIAAAVQAESHSDITLPREFRIDLQAFGYSGPLLTCDQAIDRIFIDKDKFYRIIDVAVTGIQQKYSVAFVRVSGHSPDLFSKTKNPKELGPFNIMVSEKIEKET